MFEQIMGLVIVIFGIITFYLGHWNFSYDENLKDIPVISLLLSILLLISGTVSIIGGSYIVLVG